MTNKQRIHDASMEILRDVGIKFHSEDAVQVLKNNGIEVKGDIAHFTEDQIMHWVKMAPSSFTIHARNPKYNAEVGGDTTHPCPAYGCAFIAERDGRQRAGTLEDYIKCARLIHANEDYIINGGTMIQPCDIPDETAPLSMFYSTLLHSDKAMMVTPGSKDIVESLMKAGCELFGGVKELLVKPRMFTLINTNSPLSLDKKMLDCLMLFAKYGQPVILAPAAMLGATGPLSLAGTLASGNAEDLAGIALAQMVRPGTPVVYGMQSTAVDMRSVSFACAAPEGTVMQGFGARMARFYGMPSRGGGSQTDAPVVNAQAGYESMLTFYSAYRHGINLVLEAGGVLASVNATSFDKMICDFEIIRQVKAAFAPLEVNEETLNMEDIKENAHTGNFLTTDYTLENFTDLYAPQIGSRSASGGTYFEDSIDKETSRLLQLSEERRPELDNAAKNNLKSLLVKTSGMDIQQLEQIEKLACGQLTVTA